MENYEIAFWFCMATSWSLIIGGLMGIGTSGMGVPFAIVGIILLKLGKKKSDLQSIENVTDEAKK